MDQLLDPRLEVLVAGCDELPLLRDFRAELSTQGLALRLGCEEPGFEVIERMVRIGEQLAVRSRATLVNNLTGPESLARLV